MRRRLLASVLLTLAVVGVSSIARTRAESARSSYKSFAPASDEIVALEQGKSVERTLSGGQRHLYRLGLQAGEYARVVVEQRGIDVTVQLQSTDGQPIAEFQEEVRPDGQERIEVVADDAAAFTLVVKAAWKKTSDGAYVIQLVETRPATAEERSMHQARMLRASADRLNRAGRFNEARPLLERALSLGESARGSDDLEVAGLVRDVANVENSLERFTEAQPLYERALRVMERSLGADHPTTAFTSAALGAVYSNMGQYPKGEYMVRRALESLEKTLGPEHPLAARCQIWLGSFRYAEGDSAAGEPFARRAIEILERDDETDSFSYADALFRLAEMRFDQKAYRDADPLFRRSIAVAEKTRGAENAWVAKCWQRLGVTARMLKDYAGAEDDYRRSLAIVQKIWGPEHAEVAANLNNLGNIYRLKGDIAQSLDMHLRALRIWEQTTGRFHGNALLALGNIARTYAATGDIPNAIAFQRRAETVLEKEFALNVAAGSERQKISYATAVTERTDRTVSLSVNEASDWPEASALAAHVLLQRKGRVLDAMSDTFEALRERVGTVTDRDALDRLRAMTARLAKLVLGGPQGTTPEEHQKAIEDLESAKERLEADISAHSAEFRARSQPVSLEAVQAAIPADAALVEFVVARPFDPKAENNDEAYGERRYVAYVIGHDTAPRARDLGPASAIDSAIDALRRRLRDPNSDVSEPSRTVDRQVLQPIRASLGNARRLLVSPDGELNLIPFEALVDEHGRYEIERYAITYLTSGRDLLRMQVPRASKGVPVVFANPAFGGPPTGDAPDIPRRSVTTAKDWSTVFFAPLSSTSEEAQAIRSLFPNTTLFTGPRATKAALEQLQAPLMLHIATHGFFLQQALRPRSPTPVPSIAGGMRAISATARVENPLLRSGLALSGANTTDVKRDDGVLTALEASHLNLWGTKLVTLSACDTGVGEVKNGEGVYGLRRAFFIAGAETLVMSLWPVSDRVTRDMMVAYYTGLRRGLGRGDALRQAELAMMARTYRRHPFYWASFIQAGEWANLAGNH